MELLSTPYIIKSKQLPALLMFHISAVLLLPFFTTVQCLLSYSYSALLLCFSTQYKWWQAHCSWRYLILVKKNIMHNTIMSQDEARKKSKKVVEGRRQSGQSCCSVKLLHSVCIGIGLPSKLCHHLCKHGCKPVTFSELLNQIPIAYTEFPSLFFWFQN